MDQIILRNIRGQLLSVFTILALLSLMSCGDEPDDGPNNDVLNESTKFSTCNSLMTDCRNGTGDYCLNGFKWGTINPVPDAGEHVTGPRESGGTISYSFQESNGLVNTHAQIDLPSLSFDLLATCAKEEMRRALSDWAAVADINFEEVPENSDSDIRFFVAEIRQSGVGFPNFPETPCDILGGTAVFQADLWTEDCDVMYLFFLHEIGHVLGLGHVGTTNIMNSDFSVIESLDGLQMGDISGVQQLYGVKE